MPLVASMHLILGGGILTQQQTLQKYHPVAAQHLAFDRSYIVLTFKPPCLPCWNVLYCVVRGAAREPGDGTKEGEWGAPLKKSNNHSCLKRQ